VSHPKTAKIAGGEKRKSRRKLLQMILRKKRPEAMRQGNRVA
jgi:hypothetical protein